MRRLFVLLPVVAVLMAYLPVLSAALVWDDHTLLQASVLQAPWEPLPFNPDYFRPLGVVSLQLGEAAANPLPHAARSPRIGPRLRGSGFSARPAGGWCTRPSPGHT